MKKKWLIILLLGVMGVFFTACDDDMQTEKVYEFDKIEVVFENNPSDTLSYYNVFEKNACFLLEDNSEIIISNLNWVKKYPNKEFQRLQKEESNKKNISFLLTLAIVGLAFVLFRALTI